MHLYQRNYKKISKEEQNKYEEILLKEQTGRRFGKINHYSEYPEAAKHYLSLFPNNHIVLSDVKNTMDLREINNQFLGLIQKEDTNEQSILRFINHSPQAYHIICSILSYCGFRIGHHDTYLFPEFWLGDKYRADYLILGKGSGGYEFVFVELEKPHGWVTLKDGNPGKIMRDGNFQVNDWEYWIEGNFVELKDFFEKEKSEFETLPDELTKFDKTRVHYVVVAGMREDFSDKTYRYRREESQKSDITFLHYNNLHEAAELLVDRNTF